MQSSSSNYSATQPENALLNPSASLNSQVPLQRLSFSSVLTKNIIDKIEGPNGSDTEEPYGLEHEINTITVLDTFANDPEYYNKFREKIVQKFSGEEYDQGFLNELKFLIEEKKIELTFEDLKLACLNGHYQLAEAFFSSLSREEKNIQFHNDSLGKTILHHLAITNLKDYDPDLVKKIVDLLLENYVDINKKDFIGKTALFYSILKKNEVLFKILIDKNIDRQDQSNQGQACIVGNPDELKNNSMLVVFRIAFGRDMDKIHDGYQKFLIPLLKSGALITKVNVDKVDDVYNDNIEIVVNFFNSYSSPLSDDDKQLLKQVLKGILNNPLNVAIIAFLSNPDVVIEDFKKDFLFADSLIGLLKEMTISKIESQEVKELLKTELVEALEYHGVLAEQIKKGLLPDPLSTLSVNPLSSNSDHIFFHPQGLIMNPEQEDYDDAFKSAVEICFTKRMPTQIVALSKYGCDLNYVRFKNEQGEPIIFAEFLKNHILDLLKKISSQKDQHRLIIARLKCRISLINLSKKGFNLYLIDDKVPEDFDDHKKKVAVAESKNFSSKQKQLLELSQAMLGSSGAKKERDFFSMMLLRDKKKSEISSKSENIEKLFAENHGLIVLLRSELSKIYFEYTNKLYRQVVDNAVKESGLFGDKFFFENSKGKKMLNWLMNPSSDNDDQEMAIKKMQLKATFRELIQKRFEFFNFVCNRMKFNLKILQNPHNKFQAFLIEDISVSQNSKIENFFLKLSFDESYFLNDNQNILIFKVTEKGISYHFDFLTDLLKNGDYDLIKTLLIENSFNIDVKKIIKKKLHEHSMIYPAEALEYQEFVKFLKNQFAELEKNLIALYQEVNPDQGQSETADDLTTESYLQETEGLFFYDSKLDYSLKESSFPVVSSKITEQELEEIREKYQDLEIEDHKDSLKFKTTEQLLRIVNGKRDIEIERVVNIDRLEIKDLKDFTRGCCFLISYDQELLLTQRIAEECQDHEFRKSYDEFCHRSDFRVVKSDLNFFKHLFHKKFDELVEKIHEGERDSSISEIKDYLYFLLALSHASKQKQLDQVKDDIQINYGLGHASNSSKSEVVKSIFILENLTNIYSQQRDHLANPDKKILDWLKDLYRQSSNEGTKKIDLEYRKKEVDIEDSQYLSLIVRALALSERNQSDCLEKISETVHNFCLVYCYFIGEICKVQVEDCQVQKSKFKCNQELITELNLFLASEDSKDPKKFFKFLAGKSNLLELFDFMGSSQFITSQDESLNSLDILSQILTKFNFKKTSIEDVLDDDSEESGRYKSLIDSFFGNSLVKISDLKKQNLQILKAYLVKDRSSSPGPARHEKLARTVIGNAKR